MAEPLSIRANTTAALTRCIQERVNVPQDGIWGTQTARAVLSALTGAWPPPKAPDKAAAVLVFDARTEAVLATLQPGAQRAFRPFLARAVELGLDRGVQVQAICGYRNAEEQKRAYVAGASKAMYGQSWHNYGMAIDLGCFRGGAYLDETSAALVSDVYRALGRIAPQYGLEWGGNWASFCDEPHFQIDLRRSRPSADDFVALSHGNWRYV